MTLFKYSAVAVSLVCLSACNTLGLTGSDEGLVDGEGGVIVEDRGVTSGVDGDGISGSDYGDAEANVIVGDELYDAESINDPASILANRIVYFEYDSSAVREQDQVILEAHAAYLSTNPTARVRLEGHTDDRGSREYNLALGERRAMAIRQILMIQGAASEQFQITSFGEERPQSEGEGEAVWQQNRRVELIYTGR